MAEGGADENAALPAAPGLLALGIIPILSPDRTTEGLARHGRDALEVPVTMQQGQTLEFGRRRHDEIYGSGAAVLPSLGQCFLDTMIVP